MKINSLPATDDFSNGQETDLTINKKIRILIVDDSAHVRQGLVTMLSLAARNMKLELDLAGEACNGNEAILRAEALQPDMILMDLEMPVLDGYLATQWIKSAHPSILIVALSIHSDPASRQKAAQAGVDAFIEKGAPLDELIQAIQKSRKVL